jgi:hypothetical protein
MELNMRKTSYSIKRLSAFLLTFILTSCGSGNSGTPTDNKSNLSLPKGSYLYSESIYTNKNGQCVESTGFSKSIEIVYEGQCIDLGYGLSTCDIKLNTEPCLRGSIDGNTEVIFSECTNSYLGLPNNFYAKVTTTDDKGNTCTGGVLSFHPV